MFIYNTDLIIIILFFIIIIIIIVLMMKINTIPHNDRPCQVATFLLIVDYR